MPVQKEYQHPFFIRASHWINFLALAMMVASGLRIYNASPIWGFTIPADFTLGGWLAGARQWHFFAMWILVANGTIYVLYNLLTRHGRRTTLFGRPDVRGILPMILYYLRTRKKHPESGKYNALQKLAYTLVPLVALIALLSGLAIYWPVQLRVIAGLFGGYDAARVWHFLVMAALVLFFIGHLFMVALAGWNNFLSMITGWKKISPPPTPRTTITSID